MVTQVPSPTQKDIIYPESDGQPMADNTIQFELIVFVKKNFDLLYANNPNVFVAGDLLWYPIEGNNNKRRAPDVMIVFGRPKGDRGSYLQWKEDNIPPQVVFEILSPGNTPKEMIAKYKFYERHGVEEYYLYDPDTNELAGWLKSGDELVEIEQIEGWVSPRLVTRFEVSNGKLEIYRPDGQPFVTYEELAQAVEQAQAEAEQERLRAQQAQVEVEQERLRVQQAQEQLQALRALLRQRGINPDEL
ncbi:Uma2 family endonuclease [Iningainema tapete]|uniref:Uma2 family endonuclease n=1 Tax=Iningainema tapete BLCC-T55 TaxID=2748662 RepID=A0A8J6XRQ2_9CYAN|nr:Uma2 family endonuclease [Iningainema tapete]MBD2777175.1 Uma2 family endonuclease [Iningainema tapete BLCC-T55]